MFQVSTKLGYSIFCKINSPISRLEDKSQNKQGGRQKKTNAFVYAFFKSLATQHIVQTQQGSNSKCKIFSLQSYMGSLQSTVSEGI